MKIHVIVGPTASGKSNAAHILSDLLNCPIINADAYQVYKDMNIGTNKVEKSDSHYDKYHLLDIISPDVSFNVANYQKVFREKIDELSKLYNDVIVVGGNGLYIKASLYDYSFQDEELQNVDFSNYTNDELYKELQNKDYESSLKIHPNNRKRVIRALTICMNSLVSKSTNENMQKHCLFYKEDDVKIYFINPVRDELYGKINNRVDDMINNGLIEEVSYLLETYNLSNTAVAAIGYKEVISYLKGEIEKKACIELIKKRTRNYAKRQITFFKNQFKYQEFKSVNELVEWFKNEQSI